MNVVTAPQATAITHDPTPAPRPRKRSLSWRLRTGAGLSYLMLSVLALIYIYPFLVTLSSAFKTDDEATDDPLRLIPQIWSFASFDRLFTEVPLPLWAMNTVFVTITITLGRVFFDSLAGYALSRLRFRGRGFVFASLIAVMAVPGVVLLIPRFLILRQFGMYDSYAGMIVPLLVDAAGIFIMKQFFESIPS